jgi:hypothetical protein
MWRKDRFSGNRQLRPDCAAESASGPIAAAPAIKALELNKKLRLNTDMEFLGQAFWARAALGFGASPIRVNRA